MCKLPNELLTTVAEHADIRTLKTLRKVNSSWRSAALPILLKEVQILVYSSFQASSSLTPHGIEVWLEIGKTWRFRACDDTSRLMALWEGIDSKLVNLDNYLKYVKHVEARGCWSIAMTRLLPSICPTFPRTQKVVIRTFYDTNGVDIDTTSLKSEELESVVFDINGTTDFTKDCGVHCGMNLTKLRLCTPICVNGETLSQELGNCVNLKSLVIHLKRLEGRLRVNCDELMIVDSAAQPPQSLQPLPPPSNAIIDAPECKLLEIRADSNYLSTINYSMLKLVKLGLGYAFTSKRQYKIADECLYTILKKLGGAPRRIELDMILDDNELPVELLKSAMELTISNRYSRNGEKATSRTSGLVVCNNILKHLIPTLKKLTIKLVGPRQGPYECYALDRAMNLRELMKLEGCENWVVQVIEHPITNSMQLGFPHHQRRVI